MDRFEILYITGQALALLANFGLAAMTNQIWGSLQVRREFRHYGVSRAPVNVYLAEDNDDSGYILWGLLLLVTLGGVALLFWALIPAWEQVGRYDMLLAAGLMFIVGASFWHNGSVLHKFAHARAGNYSALGVILQFLGAVMLLTGIVCVWSAQGLPYPEVTVFDVWRFR